MNIENKKQIAIIVLAIGLGLVASVLTGNHIQNSIKTEAAKRAKEFENKKMKPLMQEMAAMRREIKRLASRPSQTIVKGPTQKAAPVVPTSSLALRTPAGKRAYTVRIDSLSAVGGMINPGDYIDILAHMKMPDPVDIKKTKIISSVIFQNIQILAVGTNLKTLGGYEKQQQARALNLTLALTPEEAGLMSFVERNAKMQMILRAPAETKNEVIQVSTWSTLADYVFEQQGTELVIPRDRAFIKAVSGEKPPEVKPFIEIFKGGQQL